MTTTVRPTTIGEAGDGAGDGEGAGQGRRQEGFGNRGARFAEQLGLDYEDLEVQETIDGCMPALDDALAAAGLGQPAGAGEGQGAGETDGAADGADE